MPGFPFTTIEPNQLGQVSKWDVPFNDWVNIKFQSAQDDTLGVALSRATEDFIWDDHNPARPDVLNEAYGIPGQLNFTEPMSAQRARLMHERKRGELERLAYIESASHSWASAKAAAGFGASLVGGLSHPLDLGLAFLPFIGSEKEAAEVAKMGGSAWQKAIARGVAPLHRGIISEEALIAEKIPYAKLTGALIDGTLNQAVTEIPVAIQKHRDQAIYGFEDSAFNILAGGAFAGAMKGLSLTLERAARLWRELDPRMREAALYDTARTILTGDPPRSHWAFDMDEATIRAKVDEKVRADNPFVAPAPPKNAANANELLILAKQGAATPGIEGTIYTRLLERYSEGERSIEFFQQIAALSDRTYVPEKEGIADVSFEKLENARTKDLRREQHQINEVLNELKNRLTHETEPLFVRQANSNIHRLESRLSEIESELSGAGRPMTEAELEIHRAEQNAMREKSVNDFLEKSKADHEARIKGLVDAETQKVMNEVKRQTPPLPDKQREKYTFKRTPEDKDIAALEQDIETISKDILNLASTPEERAALEAEINAIKKEMAENPASAEKAVDAMTPCVTAKAKG